MSEEIGNLQVNIGLNSQGFQQGISSVNKQLKVAQAEFRNAASSLKDFGKGTEGLKAKSDYLTKSISLQQQKVDSLKEAYEKSKSETGENSQKTQELAIQYNNAQTKLNYLEKDLQKANETLKTQSNGWIQLGNKMKTAGDKMKSVGSKVSDVGKEMSLKVTAPLAAIGTGLVAIGTKFDDAYDKIRIGTGATGKNLKGLEGDFKAVAKDVPDSFDDISTSIADLNTKLNLSGKPLQNFSTQMLNLSRLTGIDLTQNIDSVSKSFQAFGIKAADYGTSLDYVFKVSQSTGIGLDKLLADTQKFAPALKNMGMSFEASTTLMGQLSKAGVDVEGVMTGLNKGISNMAKKGVTDANKAVGILFNTIKNAPTDMKATQAAVEIFGTKAGSQLAKAIKEGKMSYTDLMNTLKNSKETINGATSDTEDWAEGFKKLKNNLMVALEPLAGSFFNAVSKLIPTLKRVVEGITKISDKFASLSPKQQDMIIKIGLTVAAIGPLLGVMGKVITVGGSLSHGIGAIVTKLGTASIATAGVGTAGTAGASGIAALGSTLGSAVIAAAPFIAAGAAIAGAGYLIYKKLNQEATPAVNLFAKGVSDSTKKVVGAYVKMDDDVTKTLSNLYVNSSVITNKTVTDLTSKYTKMGNDIKTGMDKKYQEEFTNMQNFFNNSSTLTADEEAKALINLQKNNGNKKVEIDNYEKQIQIILQNASNSHRSLTQNEQEQINTIQSKMKTQAVKTLSDSEVESKVILERLKSYSTRITAEQASAEVKNANKARDGAVKAASEQYDKSVATIIKMRDETHSITADQADKLIADAKRQKDGSIKNAEDMKKGVTDKITQMNSDTEKSVDLSTGKILTFWDKLKRWWNGWTPESKETTITTNYTENHDVTKRKIGHNASGTNNWRGGLTWIGEQGAELVELPKGSKVYPNDKSMKMAKDNTASLTLHIDNFVNNREQDIQALSEELAFYMKQKKLGTGGAY